MYSLKTIILCVCVCVYIYIYIYIYVCVCVYVCVRGRPVLKLHAASATTPLVLTVLDVLSVCWQPIPLCNPYGATIRHLCKLVTNLL